MEEDHYEILGVSREASEEEIKRRTVSFTLERSPFSIREFTHCSIAGYEKEKDQPLFCHVSIVLRIK